MADLLYNYLSKGMTNHLLTFSEFIGFCRDFTLSPANHRAVLFKIISDCDPDGLLKILTLLRVFVTSPKGSPFANEIMSILSFYVAKTLRSDTSNTKEVVYDLALYNKLVPYSSLATELVYKFTVLPHKAFLPTGEPNPEFEAASPAE